MSLIVAIVADDLTGAGDTAVQFVRAGWQTHLSMADVTHALRAPVDDVEVLAVSTYTRSLPPELANAIVAQEVRLLREAGVKHVYKKVDSTLRGSFKAEIEGARLAWREDAIAIVCPAFPGTGRTVRDGVLLVNGEPVTSTSAATDPVTPVTESHIPTLVGGTQISIDPRESAAQLAARLEAGGPIVVVDAQNGAELEQLANAIVLVGERALPVGAGGLAAPLAALWAGQQTRGDIVVMVSSQHSAARAQALAVQAAGARVWAPESTVLADADLWQQWCDERIAEPANTDSPGGMLLILAPADRMESLDSYTVAARLGELAARVIVTHGAAGVIATGGDGANEVLRYLDATGIALVDEVTGGVPVGTLTGGRAAGLPVVTKAGGFGEQDVLVRAARLIRNRRFKV